MLIDSFAPSRCSLQNIENKEPKKYLPGKIFHPKDLHIKILHPKDLERKNASN